MLLPNIELLILSIYLYTFKQLHLKSALTQLIILLHDVLA